MATYTILLFGPASSAIGNDRIEVVLDDQVTVAELKQAMIAAFPAIEQFVTAGRLAVNQGFAAMEDQVNTDSEIALISMVSGG
jgi:molybdopterin synthase catalytic subunit/molybdopterin synthase sulfur carrier subunit